jgi:phosphoribosylaminoimidazole-succinocarboxamide synthase
MQPTSETLLADIEPFLHVDLPLEDRRDGKVRSSFALPDDSHGRRRLFVTTDRLSAFDRVIAGVPYKGQVLNELAAWWFANTADIVANHVLDVPDPNLLVARDTEPLAVEVVVRGYITGVTSTSLWQRYADGAREIYGHRLPDGLGKNTALPHPLVTPTTKAGAGGHDEPISVADVARSGIVEPRLWGTVVEAALEVFARGQRVAADAGLILADTKYEFGVTADGQLLLIDEMHTPDSSRYWVAATYEQRLAAGEEPESLDKEVVRRALVDTGFRGDGPPPELPDDVWHGTSRRYVTAYETITGTQFRPGTYPVGPRLLEALHRVPPT